MSGTQEWTTGQGRNDVSGIVSSSEAFRSLAWPWELKDSWWRFIDEIFPCSPQSPLWTKENRVMVVEKIWLNLDYCSTSSCLFSVAMAAPPSDAERSCVLIDVTNFVLADSEIIRTQNSSSLRYFPKGQRTYNMLYYRRQMKCEQSSCGCDVWTSVTRINMAEELECIVPSGMDWCAGA